MIRRQFIDIPSKICSIIPRFRETAGEKSTIQNRRVLSCIESRLPLSQLSAGLKEELLSSTLIPQLWEILFPSRLC